MPVEIDIAVLSSHRHPRLRYILKELGRQLGFRFRLMTDAANWETTAAAAKVSLLPYAGSELAVSWPAHRLLSGSNPTITDLETTWHEDKFPLFFPTPGAGTFQHDYLAMMFYCLSRYEEYGDFKADAHQRFPASGSHAFQQGYLHLPVVNLWSRTLYESLLEAFPQLPPAKLPAFDFIPTYDIDLLWAWQYRGLRGVGAGMRDFFQGHYLRAWKRFVTPKHQDPYQTLDFLEDLHRAHPHLSPIYFWLLADSTDRRDPNPFPVPAGQQELMRELAAKYTAGIHPGYLSSDQPERFREEASRLAKITGVAVRHSRQHFLRFRTPETFRQLRMSGISHDYSMGYADAVGWRAGTNFPYFWYDLEREKATGLTIHPFAAMDVTLKNYLQLDPEAAKQQVLQLAHTIRPFGGPFMLLWHNTSFAEIYGWERWREVYVKLFLDLSAIRTTSG